MSDDRWLRRGQPQYELWYEIAPIGLDFITWLVIWFHDIIIAFFLDTSFDEHISVWEYGLVRKNLLNPVRNWKENHIYQLVKNLLNLIKKRERKPGDSIDKKSPKLDNKTKRKTDHLLLCIFAYKRWKIFKI